MPRWVDLDPAGRVLDGPEDTGLRPGHGPHAARLLEAAAGCGGTVTPMLQALEDLPPDEVPHPGRGRTLALWELLASVSAADLVAARVLEPHLDALAILDQAGIPAPTGVLGVYASESGGRTAHARPVAGAGGGWTLSGTKPWCSLAESCAAAVVTAALPDGGRRAFLVDLRHPGVRTGEGRWSALGLAALTSTPVTFRDVPAVPVGGPSWYLERPGFAWGGMGVAAVWFGGAVHLYRTLVASVRRREPDQVALAALGHVDRLLATAGAHLAGAAAAIDAGRLDGPAGALEAYRLRGTVAQACTEVIDVVGKATGPGPLTGDAAHARAVADLQVYVRQHHAWRDDAAAGALLLDQGAGADPPPPTAGGAARTAPGGERP